MPSTFRRPAWQAKRATRAAGRLGRDAQAGSERRPQNAEPSGIRGHSRIGNDRRADPRSGSSGEQRSQAGGQGQQPNQASGKRGQQSQPSGVMGHGPAGTGQRLQPCHRCQLERQLRQRRPPGSMRRRWPHPRGPGGTFRKARTLAGAARLTGIVPPGQWSGQAGGNPSSSGPSGGQHSDESGSQSGCGGA